MSTKPRDLVTRFLSDVLPFLRGTDKVEDAFHDVADAQDKLVREGQDASRDVGRAYERMGDKIKRETRDATRDTKQSFKETGKEAGQEFVSNLGESISSGDLSGVASDTAGGLAATFGMAGPIGIAFAALATGVSLKFAEIAAKAEAMRQKVQSEFDAIRQGADDQANLDRRLEEAFGTTSEGITELRRMAGEVGVSFDDLVEALIDGGPEAQALADKFRAQYDQLQKVRETVLDNGVATADAISANARLRDIYAELAESTKVAADNAWALSRATKDAAYWAQAYGEQSSTWASQLGAAAPYVRGSR